MKFSAVALSVALVQGNVHGSFQSEEQGSNNVPSRTDFVFLNPMDGEIPLQRVLKKEKGKKSKGDKAAKSSKPPAITISPSKSPTIMPTPATDILIELSTCSTGCEDVGKTLLDDSNLVRVFQESIVGGTDIDPKGVVVTLEGQTECTVCNSESRNRFLEEAQEGATIVQFRFQIPSGFTSSDFEKVIENFQKQETVEAIKNAGTNFGVDVQAPTIQQVPSNPIDAPTTASPTASPTFAPALNECLSQCLAPPTALPTSSPSMSPTVSPTSLPTTSPTMSPTTTPTSSPTPLPTASPASSPTSLPTSSPTSLPTASPTSSPTSLPTSSPTSSPTSLPTSSPTSSPTSLPTASPTSSPTSLPTSSPTSSPTSLPTASPTSLPTSSPTSSPTSLPTSSPTSSPTASPTTSPTESPTSSPTSYPTTTRSFEKVSSIVGLKADEIFGKAIAFSKSGNTLVVGGFPYLESDAGGWASYGTTFVYRQGFGYTGVGTISTQYAMYGLPIGGYGSAANSGNSVAVSGDGTVVAVAAPDERTLNPYGSTCPSGYVSLYKLSDDGSYALMGDEIVDSGSGQFTCYSRLGASISLSDDGTVAAIGQPRYHISGTAYYGHVRVFDYSAGTWVQRALLEPTDQTQSNLFGHSVSLVTGGDDDLIAVGAPGTNAETGQVTVYTYDHTFDQWIQFAEIDGTQGSSLFGESVSLASDNVDTYLAIGAPDSGEGCVQAYKLGSPNDFDDYGQQLCGIASGDRFGANVTITSDGQYLTAAANNYVKTFGYASTDWVEIGYFPGQIAAMTSDGGVPIVATGDLNFVFSGQQDAYSPRGLLNVYEYV